MSRTNEKKWTAKSMAGYLNTLVFLNESTDDHLYLWELAEDRLRFASQISEKFALPEREEGYLMEEWLEIVYFRDRAALKQELEQLRSGELDTHNQEYRLLDRENKWIWVRARGKLIFGLDGRPERMIGLISDRELGTKTDPVTGLMNMARLLEDLDELLARGEKGHLFILGIDNFKNINIKYGRGTGDRILKGIADVLEDAAAGAGRVYRLDGDCFAAVLPGGEEKEVIGLYEKMQERLQGICSVSAGAAAYPMTGMADGSVLCQYAENALDHAKKQGKNILSFFSIEDYRQQLSRIDLQNELLKSIRRGYKGFEIWYQPKLDTLTGRTRGAEALMRYHSPSRGEVPPDEFIPILEQTGMICSTGKWIMEKAFNQCRKWREKLPDFGISVNISYVQLREEHIAEAVLQILERTGLPGKAVTLEVTESMQLEDCDYFNRLFDRWEKVGIQIAIDDFGTGYSSLGYLSRLQIDEIKMDRCFVSQVQQNTYNYQLLDNMIELAKSRKIRVCCEGVETENELEVLQRLEPELVQGYYPGRPCTEEQFEREYIDARRLPYQKKENTKGERKEEQISGDILKATGLGLWEIRMNREANAYAMYADENMKQVMGIECPVTPEECYFHWYNRINDGYYNYVNHSVERMINSREMVQLEYTWSHPRKGEVLVRCLGVRSDDGESDEICIMGYHRIISELEQPRFLGGDNTCEMFEYNERKRAIYFHTKRVLLAGEKTREADFPESWVREKLVHPHFAGEFVSLFSKVKEKQEAQTGDFLLRNKQGEYEWFRIKTQHIGHELQDLDTVIVVLDPAKQERTVELKYMRQNDFYQAMLTETAAYAEVDVEEDELQSAGGLWSGYREEAEKKGCTFSQVMHNHLDKIVLPEDRKSCSAYTEPEYIRRIYHEGRHTAHYSFQRYMADGTVHWMRLVLHIFTERYNGSMYALLYLKDIDSEKKREMEREAAANLDPLTGIYNRRTFERQVSAWVQGCSGRCAGALILLDLDNFKMINDRYGHQKGDETLLRMADNLRETFRKNDIFGRFGGDEFIIFIKNVMSKELLNTRIYQLIERLQSDKQMPIHFSAGITFVSAEGFSYKKSLRQADVAMYESKKKGKNTISYYEEP